MVFSENSEIVVGFGNNCSGKWMFKPDGRITEKPLLSCFSYI